jgi:hypothetical protein
MDPKSYINPNRIDEIALAIENTIKLRQPINGLENALGIEPNPYKGECYIASALMQDIFGKEYIDLYRKKDYKNQCHWWIFDKFANKTIDITRKQYVIEGKPVPSNSYENAEKSSKLGFSSHKIRVEKVRKELLEYLKINNIEPV